MVDGICLAHLSAGKLQEYLANLAPGVDVDARGVVFTADLLQRLLTAARTADQPPELGTAYFSDATFSEGADFRGVIFTGAADFSRVTFTKGADFGRVTFTGGAVFRDVTFSEGADFSGVTFTEHAIFRDATFAKNADFDRVTFIERTDFSDATFTKDAVFSDATFIERTDFSDATFTMEAYFSRVTFTKDAVFSDATFTERAVFSEVTFTKDAVFNRVTFTERAYFVEVTFTKDADFRGGTVEGRVELVACAVGKLVCKGARISGELLVEAAVARVDLSGVRASGRVGLRLRGARVDLSEAVFTGPVTVHGLQTAIDGVDDTTIEWDGAAPGTRAPQVRVESLRDADAERLVLTDVDLSECRFAGMQQLEKITLDGRCRFAIDPRGTRQMLAEEHHWRAERPRRWAGRAARWTAAPDGAVLDSARLEVLYRQLRKALEDAKNEPGAADFYYGEMQMRRHGGRRGGRGFAERALVWMYWLVSGYGLRAWRAIATLLVLVALVAVAVKYAGFPGKPVPYIDALLYSVRSGFLINVKTTSVPDTVTRWGEVFRIILRITIPLLLGLAALAIRNRVKR